MSSLESWGYGGRASDWGLGLLRAPSARILLAPGAPGDRKTQNSGNLGQLVYTEANRYLIGTCCMQGRDRTFIERLPSKERMDAQNIQGKELCTHRAVAPGGERTCT